MKKAVFLSLVAVLTLFGSAQAAVAKSTVELNLEVSGGEVSALYNSATKSIELKMFVEGRSERVVVQLLDKNQNIVYNEIFVVSTHGLEVDIPIEIYGAGVFQLQVKGLSISFRGLYKFR